jgi:hypothetical protein
MKKTTMQPTRVEDDPQDPEEMITCKEAARILCISENAVRNGKAGTEGLLRIRWYGGPSGKKPSVRLLKVEVLALRSKWIAEAKEKNQFTPKERALRKYDGLPDPRRKGS